MIKSWCPTFISRDSCTVCSLNGRVCRRAIIACFQSLDIHKFKDVSEVETVGHGLISTGNMKLRLRNDKCLKW